MSKRKTDDAAALLAGQRWTYERHIDHLTLQQISDLSVRSRLDGGLGKFLSRAAVRDRIREYRDVAFELETIKCEEHMHRELADLDRVQPTLCPMTERIDREASIALAARIAGPDSVARRGQA